MFQLVLIDRNRIRRRLVWLSAYGLWFRNWKLEKNRMNRTKFEEIYMVIDLFRIQNSNVRFIIDMKINFSSVCFTLLNVYMIESIEYKWMIKKSYLVWVNNVGKTPDSWTLNTLLNFYALLPSFATFKRFKDRTHVRWSHFNMYYV